MPPPTSADITRYRYQFGTDIGSIFILERWLTPSMFPNNTAGQSELSAVQGWIKLQGIQKTTALFEKHWNEYVSDADLDWLRDQGKCTSVRLPIGYFTLGPEYTVHTPFECVAAVYKNAWAAVLALVKRCHARGMGVLVDLHACLVVRTRTYTPEQIQERLSSGPRSQIANSQQDASAS